MLDLKSRPLCVLMALIVGYVSIYYAVSSIDISVPTALPVEEEFFIILDAGHGGMDGGCSSAEGNVEKDINLAIVLEVKELCELYGYNVVLTRDRDTSIHDAGVEGIRAQKESDMDNRLEIFNSHSNAVCVSVHQNNFTDEKYSGAQMFYYEGNPENERFARIMQEKFVENLQPDNTRETKPCGDNLYLCRYCENPTVMVECGFLSNPDEAALLSDNIYQKKVAFTIFSGIMEYINT